MVLLAYEHW